MKLVCISMLCTTLLTIGPGDQPEAVFNHPSRSVVVREVTTETQQAGQTAIAFLHWYKTHLQAANRFLLVNQQAGKPYSVNLKNGERYLAFLKSSQFLTDTYLSQWRTYFKERNEGFRLNPQVEGPPTGFEYDLVMLTQDVDKQLASLKSMKIDKVTVVQNKATVVLTLLDAYEFRLIRQNNHWLINEILNTSQE
ncbi:MAG TPA: hypothetical protein VGB67_05575 [Fibrella sp.]